MELKDALLVGVGGSLWLKAIELYVWFSNLPQQDWSKLLSVLPFQILGVLIVSVPLTFLFFELFNKENLVWLIPSLYFIIKDSINVVRGLYPSNILLNTLVEAVLIGLPIGWSWYQMINMGLLKTPTWERIVRKT